MSRHARRDNGLNGGSQREGTAGVKVYPRYYEKRGLGPLWANPRRALAEIRDYFSSLPSSRHTPESE